MGAERLSRREDMEPGRLSLESGHGSLEIVNGDKPSGLSYCQLKWGTESDIFQRNTSLWNETF